MKTTISIILLCLLWHCTLAQTPTSWEKKLRETKNDTTKLRCYAELALIYGSRNLITTNTLLSEGKLISKKYPLHSTNLVFWDAVVEYYTLLGDNSKRKAYNDKILQLAMRLNNKPYLKKSAFETCNLLMTKGDYLQAIKKYYDYERLLNPESDRLLYSALYSNMAFCFVKLQNHEKAKEYIHKSLLRCYTKRDSMNYYLRISTRYFSKTLPQIEENYKIGLKLSRELNDVAVEISFLSNMATYYLEFGKNELSRTHNQLALNLATKNGFVQDVALCNLTDGNIYYVLKQYKKALISVNKGIVVIRKSELRNYLLDALYTRRATYEVLGNYKNAYRDLKESLEIGNKSIGAEKQRLSVEFEGKLKVEQKQAQIETIMLKNRLQQERIATEQKQKYWLMAGLFIMAILLVAALWNYIKVRKLSQKLKEKSLKLEQKTLDLEEINRSKDKLFGILSHDLREPLNELKAILMLFYSNDISQNKMVSLSKNINNKLFTLQMMLDNLLNWAVVQLKNDLNNSTVFELEPMLNQVIEQMNEQIDRKQIEIIREKTDLKINGNEAQLEIVFRNILSNAIKFSPIKGKVSINVQKQSEQVNIRITDSGMGIKEIQMDNIYNYPISQKGTAGEKGTGLGLRLSKELLEKNNGELLLSNENKGGLTAQIILSSV